MRCAQVHSSGKGPARRLASARTCPEGLHPAGEVPVHSISRSRARILPAAAPGHALHQYDGASRRDCCGAVAQQLQLRRRLVSRRHVAGRAGCWGGGTAHRCCERLAAYSLEGAAGEVCAPALRSSTPAPCSRSRGAICCTTASAATFGTSSTAVTLIQHHKRYAAALKIDGTLTCALTEG